MQTSIKLEESYVEDVYELIANHFSGTRYKPWPLVAEFLNSFPKGSFIADVGCGNGKYTSVNPNVIMHGSDASENLLKIAIQTGMDCITCSNIHLPYKSNSMDGFISIAVIHHFSTPRRRKAAIREMIRILRRGGRGLIFVWSFEHQKVTYPSQDAYVPWYLKPEKKTDAPVPEHAKETQKGLFVKRYYHLFKQGELEELITSDKGDVFGGEDEEEEVSEPLLPLSSSTDKEDQKSHDSQKSSNDVASSSSTCSEPQISSSTPETSFSSSKQSSSISASFQPSCEIGFDIKKQKENCMEYPPLSSMLKIIRSGFDHENCSDVHLNEKDFTTHMQWVRKDTNQKLTKSWIEKCELDSFNKNMSSCGLYADSVFLEKTKVFADVLASDLQLIEQNHQELLPEININIDNEKIRQILFRVKRKSINSTLVISSNLSSVQRWRRYLLARGINKTEMCFLMQLANENQQKNDQIRTVKEPSAPYYFSTCSEIVAKFKEFTKWLNEHRNIKEKEDLNVENLSPLFIWDWRRIIFDASELKIDLTQNQKSWGFTMREKLIVNEAHTFPFSMKSYAIKNEEIFAKRSKHLLIDALVATQFISSRRRWLMMDGWDHVEEAYEAISATGQPLNCTRLSSLNRINRKPNSRPSDVFEAAEQKAAMNRLKGKLIFDYLKGNVTVLNGEFGSQLFPLTLTKAQSLPSLSLLSNSLMPFIHHQPLANAPFVFQNFTSSTVSVKLSLDENISTNLLSSWVKHLADVIHKNKSYSLIQQEESYRIFDKDLFYLSLCLLLMHHSVHPLMIVDLLFKEHILPHSFMTDVISQQKLFAIVFRLFLLDAISVCNRNDATEMRKEQTESSSNESSTVHLKNDNTEQKIEKTSIKNQTSNNIQIFNSVYTTPPNIIPSKDQLNLPGAFSAAHLTESTKSKQSQIYSSNKALPSLIDSSGPVSSPFTLFPQSLNNSPSSSEIHPFSAPRHYSEDISIDKSRHIIDANFYSKVIPQKESIYGTSELSCYQNDKYSEHFVETDKKFYSFLSPSSVSINLDSPKNDKRYNLLCQRISHLSTERSVRNINANQDKMQIHEQDTRNLCVEPSFGSKQILTSQHRSFLDDKSLFSNLQEFHSGSRQTTLSEENKETRIENETFKKASKSTESEVQELTLTRDNAKKASSSIEANNSSQNDWGDLISQLRIDESQSDFGNSQLENASSTQISDIVLKKKQNEVSDDEAVIVISSSSDNEEDSSGQSKANKHFHRILRSAKTKASSKSDSQKKLPERKAKRIAIKRTIEIEKQEDSIESSSEEVSIHRKKMRKRLIQNPFLSSDDSESDSNNSTRTLHRSSSDSDSSSSSSSSSSVKVYRPFNEKPSDSESSDGLGDSIDASATPSLKSSSEQEEQEEVQKAYELRSADVQTPVDDDVIAISDDELIAAVVKFNKLQKPKKHKQTVGTQDYQPPIIEPKSKNAQHIMREMIEPLDKQREEQIKQIGRALVERKHSDLACAITQSDRRKQNPDMNLKEKIIVTDVKPKYAIEVKGMKFEEISQNSKKNAKRRKRQKKNKSKKFKNEKNKSMEEKPFNKKKHKQNESSEETQNSKKRHKTLHQMSILNYLKDASLDVDDQLRSNELMTSQHKRKIRLAEEDEESSSYEEELEKVSKIERRTGTIKERYEGDEQKGESDYDYNFVVPFGGKKRMKKSNDSDDDGQTQFNDEDSPESKKIEEKEEEIEELPIVDGIFNMDETNIPKSLHFLFSKSCVVCKKRILSLPFCSNANLLIVLLPCFDVVCCDCLLSHCIVDASSSAKTQSANSIVNAQASERKDLLHTPTEAAGSLSVNNSTNSSVSSVESASERNGMVSSASSTSPALSSVASQKEDNSEHSSKELKFAIRKPSFSMFSFQAVLFLRGTNIHDSSIKCPFCGTNCDASHSVPLVLLQLTALLLSAAANSKWIDISKYVSKISNKQSNTLLSLQSPSISNNQQSSSLSASQQNSSPTLLRNGSETAQSSSESIASPSHNHNLKAVDADVIRREKILQTLSNLNCSEKNDPSTMFSTTIVSPKLQMRLSNKVNFTSFLSDHALSSYLLKYAVPLSSPLSFILELIVRQVQTEKIIVLSSFESPLFLLNTILTHHRIRTSFIPTHTKAVDQWKIADGFVASAAGAVLLLPAIALCPDFDLSCAQTLVVADSAVGWRVERLVLKMMLKGNASKRQKLVRVYSSGTITELWGKLKERKLEKMNSKNDDYAGKEGFHQKQNLHLDMQESVSTSEKEEMRNSHLLASSYAFDGYPRQALKRMKANRDEISIAQQTASYAPMPWINSEQVTASESELDASAHSSKDWPNTKANASIIDPFEEPHSFLGLSLIHQLEPLSSLTDLNQTESLRVLQKLALKIPPQLNDSNVMDISQNIKNRQIIYPVSSCSSLSFSNNTVDTKKQTKAPSGKTIQTTQSPTTLGMNALKRKMLPMFRHLKLASNLNLSSIDSLIFSQNQSRLRSMHSLSPQTVSPPVQKATTVQRFSPIQNSSSAPKSLPAYAALLPLPPSSAPQMPPVPPIPTMMQRNQSNSVSFSVPNISNAAASSASRTSLSTFQPYHQMPDPFASSVLSSTQHSPADSFPGAVYPQFPQSLHSINPPSSSLYRQTSTPDVGSNQISSLPSILSNQKNHQNQQQSLQNNFQRQSPELSQAKAINVVDDKSPSDVFNGHSAQNHPVPFPNQRLLNQTTSFEIPSRFIKESQTNTIDPAIKQHSLHKTLQTKQAEKKAEKKEKKQEQKRSQHGETQQKQSTGSSEKENDGKKVQNEPIKYPKASRYKAKANNKEHKKGEENHKSTKEKAQIDASSRSLEVIEKVKKVEELKKHMASLKDELDKMMKEVEETEKELGGKSENSSAKKEAIKKGLLQQNMPSGLATQPPHDAPHLPLKAQTQSPQISFSAALHPIPSSTLASASPRSSQVPLAQTVSENPLPIFPSPPAMSSALGVAAPQPSMPFNSSYSISMLPPWQTYSGYPVDQQHQMFNPLASPPPQQLMQPNSYSSQANSHQLLYPPFARFPF
ncbi:putative tRNA methyltransferase Trm9 [Monocercomonoides exilis]|uniref:putative tRNA methyltransferase Trm9 n=1 Tax=Monocercomonoides exilis TaxID=2049356 RepID=UPI003559CFCB|nr:putative tRNA methyltransferase Trm9 [Monocercomonoides exilis]|eukprot:MONOS_6563.1-p1 / transcript=MONOS_6563.1 / gene=MONOS_6563 / organism=Monocercomonoides_exilis_PA203 / gene_product=tRNA methyltransferase Trm9 / transcript_product=tRNA methyltransferase Trm9 / location=Mono_scaffold00208:70287-79769(-) / protein_length=3028 / sequence_SO=supercontig / SO=protein_coding / is_pseudo=false